MLRSSLVSAALLAATVLTADVAAQWCPPFSRFGLHRVRDWAEGSTLQVGRVDQGDSAIALTFRFDAACGVVITSVAHRGTRPDGTVTLFEYSTEPPASCPKGLWRARFRPLDSEVPIELTPEDADFFGIWADDRNDPRRVVFRWADLEVDPDADFISWMELQLCVHGNRAEWHSRLGRIARRGSEIFTLDEVFAPVIYTRQPTFDARILVPMSSSLATPGGGQRPPDTNMPMLLWSAFGIDLEIEHPARGQQMQFSAVYTPSGIDIPAGDAVVSSRRKILYFSTEDSRGYYKRFKHKAVLDGGALHYQWSSIYFPVYGPTPFINFHFSPYPAVMCALEARSDAFWYDVCEHYRNFVEREMSLTPIASSDYRLNPDFVDAGPFVATASLGANADLEPIYRAYVDQAIRMQQFFTGADGEVKPTFMEWQSWLKGDPLPPLVEDPIGPGFNPRPFSGADVAFKEPTIFARDQIDRAHANDINMSVYTIPLFLDETEWTTFRPEWFLFTRDGARAQTGRAGSLVDYGNFGVPLWFAGVFYDDIMDAVPNLGGVFMDVFSGGGAFLRYPQNQDLGLLFKRRYHGGTRYVRGQVRAMDLTRLRIRLRKETDRHPDVPFIASESVQEFLAGHFDFAQHGIKPVPYQMWHNKLFDVFVGIPGSGPFSTPVEASNPSPPLWNAVYHEWARAEGLTVSLSRGGVGLFDGGSQPPVPGFGLTYQEWGDYMRMVHALWWFQGMKATTFQYLNGFDTNLLGQEQNLLVESAEGVEPVSPEPQIVNLLAFMKRLHEALDRDDEAGQFLVSGQMQRPLQTPDAISGAVISQGVTPAFDVGTKTIPFPFPGFVPAVFHFYEDVFSQGIANPAFGQPVYSVPHVFHSVWRSVDDDGDGDAKLGIVFVNWSDQSATWNGVFDPSLYGELDDDDDVGTFTITGLRPDGAGVTEFPVGVGAGPTRIAWDPSAGATGGIVLTHHAAAAPGLMPPRSLQVFLVELPD